MKKEYKSIQNERKVSQEFFFLAKKWVKNVLEKHKKSILT
jgi:hypothetical protein